VTRDWVGHLHMNSEFSYRDWSVKIVSDYKSGWGGCYRWKAKFRGAMWIDWDTDKDANVLQGKNLYLNGAKEDAKARIDKYIEEQAY